MKILVIHAAKLEARAEHIDRMLSHFGFEYEFISKADLEDLTEELLCKYFQRGKEMYANLLPRYSCATKHLLAVEYIVAHRLEGALILEDDIVLRKDFRPMLIKSIVEYHQHYVDHPVIISYEDSSLQFVPRSERKPGQMLYPGKKDRMAGAYYMNRCCAETILKDLAANKCPTTDADTYHYDLLKRGVIEYLWCQPPVATQGSFTGAFRSTLSSKKDRLITLRWWFKKNYKRLLYWFR